jgi:hypothetical protein
MLSLEVKIHGDNNRTTKSDINDCLDERQIVSVLVEANRLSPMIPKLWRRRVEEVVLWAVTSRRCPIVSAKGTALHRSWS